MSDAARITTALADRYRIDRELGRGGMATVYLAHDLRHDRPVALKLLHPDLAQTLGPERFQREIRLAARLQHPHILTVHDSGESAGQLWFTMPFVSGESLRDRLEREKQLPVDDALRIAGEVALALEYAHRQEVIHRDIKPENLLLTEDGSTLVADFGIARAGAAVDERLTGTGMSLGTAAYMSPEQAAGERDVDARSDVYSLAIVLYEMLAGETPFAAATPQAMIARRFTDTPRPLRAIRPSVPEHVERAVQTALTRTAADRFATARAFADALKAGQATWSAPAADGAAAGPVPWRRRISPIVATLILGVMLGGGLLFAWNHEPATELATGPRRLAVLPFENTGDTADAYFADGITDAVRGKLTSLAGLQVIASNSSNQYAATTKSPQQIAEELGVDYLLVGRVRWAKNSDGTSHVQVSPELIEAATAAATWQESFDAPLTDVFAMQAEIATRVSTALGTRLGAQEAQLLAERPTVSSAAYDLYLRGRVLRSRDAGTQRQAATYYEQAVALDSSFVDAWSALASTLSLVYANGSRDAAIGVRARTAMQRALALDPNGSAAHVAASRYYRLVDSDVERATAAVARALRAAPNDVEVLTDAAVLDITAGRIDTALVKLERARDIDPRSSRVLGTLQETYIFRRRFADAIEAGAAAIAIAPADLSLIQMHAVAYLAQGDLPGARRVIDRAIGGEVTAPAVAALFGGFYEMSWALDEPRQRLLLRLTPAAFDDDRGWWGQSMATAHWQRGDRATARAYADSALGPSTSQLAAAPDDGHLRVLRALMLAYLGRTSQALDESRLADSAAVSINRNYVAEQRIRIALAVGDTDAALDGIEALLAEPYWITPGWLRVDPTYAPLRGNPRFERMARAGG